MENLGGEYRTVSLEELAQLLGRFEVLADKRRGRCGTLPAPLYGLDRFTLPTLTGDAGFAKANPWIHWRRKSCRSSTTTTTTPQSMTRCCACGAIPRHTTAVGAAWAASTTQPRSRRGEVYRQR